MRSDRMAVNFEWGAHDGSQLSRSLVEGQLRQRYELLQDFQARCAATSGKRRNPVAQLVQHHARHCQLRWSQRLQPRHDARVPAESVADGVGAVRQHQPGGRGLPGGSVASASPVRSGRCGDAPASSRHPASQTSRACCRISRAIQLLLNRPDRAADCVSRASVAGSR